MDCIYCPIFNDNSSYDLTETTKRPISIRTPLYSDNECGKNDIRLNSYDIINECPTYDDDSFGFNLEIEAKIGCNLYSILTVYDRGLLDIPYRINIPIFNNTICNNYSSLYDSCMSTLNLNKMLNP